MYVVTFVESKYEYDHNVEVSNEKVKLSHYFPNNKIFNRYLEVRSSTTVGICISSLYIHKTKDI